MLVVLLLVLVGCGGAGSGPGSNGEGTGGAYDPDRVNPTPEKIDGSRSFEFESDEIDRAETASESVKEYCSDAVSEAQYVGCISHVEEADIP